MDEIPVVSRSQRRGERRQMLIMAVLATTLAVASFFLGVMVGERNGAAGIAQEGGSVSRPMAQIPAPPRPAATSAGSPKLTFYDDLPKGNAAPLGSGINLPKSAYVPAPPPAPAAAAASAAPPAPVAAAPVASAPVAQKTAGGGSMVVQVASTKDQGEAKRLVDKLKGKGFTAYSERADLGAKGVWYRVTVGPYADRAAADKAAAQLKKQKYSVMVRAR